MFLPDIFRAESDAAKREINQLQQEVEELRQQLVTTQKHAGAAGAEVKQLGDQSRQTAQSVDKLTEEAKEAAIGVTSLGRNIFKTSDEARKFGGVFTDVTGRLHEANGQYAQTRERIDRLGDEARESASEVQKLGNALANTGRGTSGFSRSVSAAGREAGVARKAIGLLGSVARETLTTFGAYAAIDISHAIGRVGVESVQAAGQLEQLTRATTQIEGSAEAAVQRMVDKIKPIKKQRFRNQSLFVLMATMISQRPIVSVLDIPCGLFVRKNCPNHVSYGTRIIRTGCFRREIPTLICIKNSISGCQ